MHVILGALIPGSPKISETTVLLHPDYDRRLRNLTGSADPQTIAGWWRSRAQLVISDDSSYRRWGISPRPENKTHYSA